MKEKTIKAGQYYAAKYNGRNGDLILGRVKSVRSTGEVVLENLLSGNKALKRIDVLRRRNKRISKAQADKLLEFSRLHSRQQTREEAVRMEAYENGDQPLQHEKRLPDHSLEKEVEELVKDFSQTLHRMSTIFMANLARIAIKHGGHL